MRKQIQKWAAPLVCGLLLFLCMSFLLFIGYVPSASMEPAIPAGSYVVGTRLHGELQRGDIVAFRLEGQILVKRIAAVSGDIVDIDETISLEVPAGYFHMLGDNPAASLDSRHWDSPFIHESTILARLFIPRPAQSSSQMPTTSPRNCPDKTDDQTHFGQSAANAGDTSPEVLCPVPYPR